MSVNPKMQEQLEFAKFSPGPKGSSKYTDNKEGFTLAAPPTTQSMGQGSGSGAQLSSIHLQIVGTMVQWAAFEKLVKDNSKTPTKLTHTSMLKINGSRVPIQTAEYEGLEFKNVLANFSQGDQQGTIFVDATYTTAKRQIKEYDTKGKAGPSAKSDDDLEKGTFK